MNHSGMDMNPQEARTIYATGHFFHFEETLRTLGQVDLMQTYCIVTELNQKKIWLNRPLQTFLSAVSSF